MQAAILLPKLDLLDDELLMRQKVADNYTASLEVLEDLILPTLNPENRSAWAQYSICSRNRDKVIAFLTQQNVPTAIHYPVPLNKQPAVADATAVLPVGDKVAERVFSLPISPYIGPAEQATVIEAVLGAHKL